jgi:MFS-type transporter involved in bile tolerance (Atg22 family)
VRLVFCGTLFVCMFFVTLSIVFSVVLRFTIFNYHLCHVTVFIQNHTRCHVLVLCCIWLLVVLPVLCNVHSPMLKI